MIQNNIHISPYTFPGMDSRSLKQAISSVGPSAIFDLVRERYNISAGQIKSKSRQRTIVIARHVAMYLLVTQARMSLNRIGQLTNRDHTSVIHARDKVIEYMEIYPDFRIFIEGLIRGFKMPSGNVMPQLAPDPEPEAAVRPLPVYNNSGGFQEVKRKYL